MTEEAFDVTVVGSCMTDLVRWVRPLCALFMLVDEAEAVSVPCALPEMTISQAESSEKAERGLACQIRDQETPPLPQVGPTGSSTPGMLWWPNLDTRYICWKSWTPKRLKTLVTHFKISQTLFSLRVFFFLTCKFVENMARGLMGVFHRDLQWAALSCLHKNRGSALNLDNAAGLFFPSALVLKAQMLEKTPPSASAPLGIKGESWDRLISIRLDVWMIHACCCFSKKT